MLARLSLNPIWLPLEKNVLALKGRRLRVIAPDGTAIDTIVKLAIGESEHGHKSCSVILTDLDDNPRKRTYLTQEALAMICRADKTQNGADFVVDFSRAQSVRGDPPMPSTLPGMVDVH